MAAKKSHIQQNNSNPTANTYKESNPHTEAQLYLTNSQTNNKEQFTPLDNTKVTMYVCGPTVYNPPHIGNIRSAVTFDLLYRLLRYQYSPQSVYYARNITDVDDKIIAQAAKLGVAIEKITTEMITAYNRDVNEIGCLNPNHQPQATKHIPDMISMIELLINKGYAYVAEGHVLFDVQSWTKYGELSRRNREDMIAGARVEVAPYKRNPADFVLWKPATEEEKNSSLSCSFPSPWGIGRPGWHIECSAMIHSCFGHGVDIHGGGGDLLFPHHENELAQSSCSYGGRFVGTWVHNGFVMVEGEKMSKSLGNCYTISELKEKGIEPIQLRYFYLTKHYRKPIDYTEQAMENAKKNLSTIWQALRTIENADLAIKTMVNFVDDSYFSYENRGIEKKYDKTRKKNENKDEEADKQIIKDLLDDLNTPKALATMLELANRVKKNAEEIIKVHSQNSTQEPNDSNKSKNLQYNEENEEPSKQQNSRQHQQKQDSSNNYNQSILQEYLFLKEGLISSLDILGLDIEKIRQMFIKTAKKLQQIPDEIRQIAHQRWEAKINKDWERADSLRKELVALGYDIRDCANGEYEITFAISLKS